MEPSSITLCLALVLAAAACAAEDFTGTREIRLTHGELPGKNKVENTVREAGFDFAHNVLTQAACRRTIQSMKMGRSELSPHLGA